MEEVGKILPAIFRKGVRHGRPNLVDILAPLWSRVAGKPIAQHSRPAAFENGTLTLVTHCPSWTGQLRLMAEEIRAEINSFLGELLIKRIRVHRRPEQELHQEQPRRNSSPPLETLRLEGMDALTNLDPEVAQVVARSLTKYFARRT